MPTKPEAVVVGAKTALGDLSSSLSEAAGSTLGMALQPAVEYILTIGANNPAEKTVKRLDVKAALNASEGVARNRLASSVDAAWIKGGGLGLRTGRAQMKALGLKPGKKNPVDIAALTSLKADVEAILSAIPSELTAGYLAGGKDGLVAAQKRLAYRMSLAVGAAVSMGDAAAMESLIDAEKTVKVWKARSAVPCSHCMRLDGVERAWGEPFPDHFDDLPPLKVYGGKLMGPPRHPNCLCGLVLKRK